MGSYMKYNHLDNIIKNNSKNQGELKSMSPVTSKITIRFRGSNASGILLQINDVGENSSESGGRLLVELYRRTLIVALKLKGT